MSNSESRSDTITRWQNEAKIAASALEFGNPRNLDDTWALLKCLGESTELNEILYDCGHPAYGPPEPDWNELAAIEGLLRILAEGESQ